MEITGLMWNTTFCWSLINDDDGLVKARERESQVRFGGQRGTIAPFSLTFHRWRLFRALPKRIDIQVIPKSLICATDFFFIVNLEVAMKFGFKPDNTDESNSEDTFMP